MSDCSIQPKVPESSHHTPIAGRQEEVVMTPPVRIPPVRIVMSTMVAGA